MGQADGSPQTVSRRIWGRRVARRDCNLPCYDALDIAARGLRGGEHVEIVALSDRRIAVEQDPQSRIDELLPWSHRPIATPLTSRLWPENDAYSRLAAWDATALT